MNSIIKSLNANKLMYAFFAVAVATLIVFAVVPALPNVHSGISGISLTAGLVAAEGDAGGDSGTGSDAGGDSGTGGDAGGDSGVSGDAGGDAGTSSDTSSDTSGGGGDASTIVYTSTHAAKVCTDFGFDYDIVKFGWNGSSYTSTVYNSEYTATVNGSASIAAWTATPGVAGVMAKAGIEYSTFVGGTAGSINKTAIGSGAHDISHIILCGNRVVPLTPTCTLTASPAVITVGESSLLSWSTQHATNVSLNQSVGTVAVNGTTSVAPTTNTTYTLTATGAGGTVTCAAPITAVPAALKQCALEITKSANESSLNVGDTLTYTLNFKNIGTANCTGGGVKIADVLPQEVAFVSQTQSSNVTAGYRELGTYDAAHHTVYWNADTLTPGEVGSASVTVKVKDPAQCGNFSFENKGQITAYELNNFNTWVHSNSVKTDVVNACPVPPPVCVVGVGPAAITQGQSSMLSWTTTNATEVTFDQGIGTVPVNGNRSVTPLTTTTYTGTITGLGGTVTCANTVTVTPVAIPLPVCTLDATPITITRGQSATLTWTTQDAANVSLNQNIGAVSQNGTMSVSPTTTTTYTLMASNIQGGTDCVRTITVNEPEPISCDAFTAAPGTLNAPGTTTLTWTTSNATDVSISNGVGTVAALGSRAVYVSANTTFILTATRGTETKTCSVPVTIVPDVVVPRCDAFTVSPSSVRSGASVTLTWNTTNATNVSINQSIGNVSSDGTRTATINDDTTFILTATNGSANVSCQATVTIQSSGGGGGGSSSPRCTLKASDTSVTSGEKVTLSWKNTRTNDVLLKDSRGNVLADSKKDSKIDEDEDSVDVRPTKSTAYTLTALRGSKKRTCTVDINVENVSVTSTRTRDPLVAGISLSRLPYTGFDAGPLLTAFFYTLLVVWAFGVAYMLVIRREPVLGVSLKPKKSPIREFIPKMQTGVRTTTLAPLPIIELPMRTIPAPRTIPAGEMASKHAAQGYEEYYADAPHEEIQAQPVKEEIVESITTHDAPNFELLEARAHDARMLISTDALRFITAQSGTEAEHIELLDMIIAAAKVQYPKEDGWVVINKERILGLLK